MMNTYEIEAILTVSGWVPVAGCEEFQIWWNEGMLTYAVAAHGNKPWRSKASRTTSWALVMEWLGDDWQGE
jgi:hypothetical protein